MKTTTQKPSQNPFKYGINCIDCGNPSFYFIHDGGPVVVLSCVKCGKTKEILVCTCGDDDE